MRRVAICFAFALGAVSSASAQVDAFSLRSKYGAPIDRETFKVRPEVQMIVDYGPAKQVCAIQLPSGIRDAGPPSPEIVTPEQISAIVDDVVPASMRGAELWRKTIGAGTLKIVHIEYEHLNIEERFKSDKGIGVLVIFKDPACMTNVEP